MNDTLTPPAPASDQDLADKINRLYQERAEAFDVVLEIENELRELGENV